LSKSYQKNVKFFVKPGKNQKKSNGAIVEKVQWCNTNKNSKRLEKMMKPNQTLALVLVPASTKMGDKFSVFLPSAVDPLL
jgi:hypothetical protein